MDIHLSSPNPTLVSIFSNPGQVITLDANFLIPPDRSRYANKSFDFLVFQRIWLEPIFEAFPNLAIHEAVYDELVLPSVRTYIDTNINNSPPRLTIHKDSSLTAEEYMLRNSIEEKIYPLTKYDPLLDNKDDRGEVKSLAYIAVKGLIYFATHDSNTVQLIEKAEEWMTGLDNVQVIKMYELIFYLYKTDKSENKALRMLYKYQYYLTSHEKQKNPEWGQFINAMEALYPVFN
ncbi:hypothetical protein [Petroclostridium sp. X23]|uniref:hypothetical protein n=1 Tax=Petroclostridium sp. X23 TaxID=3045146 RepID=UPI0024ACBDAA|nr:hypothetical protein [Petroclostridium sp. X23]WHH59762.1 hypothetical protein QKW49_03115 [Petroclostridium sp. X23]